MATSEKKKFNKRNKNHNKHKPSQSFDAIGRAFGKTPKWRQKELSAKKRRQQKRDELINSVKMIGDDGEDGFNEDVFASLFDDKDNVKPIEPKEDTSEHRNKKKRKRLSKKKRKLLYESLKESPNKKRRLNGEDSKPQYTDTDFIDQGRIIQTVHSKPKQAQTNSNSSQASHPPTSSAKKAEIISQIHRFELTQLMMDRIPRDYNEDTLNTYLIKLCSIECVDIHLFHNTMDDTKCGRAVITFLSPNDCALGYKCLLGHEIAPNHIVSVKAISYKYDKPMNHNKRTAADGDNTLVTNNKKCKVLKLSNLHWRTTEEDIRHFFEGMTSPLRVHIHLTSNGYPNGEAKVEFNSYKCVDYALRTLNGKTLLDREIRVEKAISKQVFGVGGKEFMNKTLQIAVFNISGGVEETDLRDFIISECGEECVPTDIHLIHHLQLFTTGYAFCKFASHDMTNRVVTRLNNKVLGERALRVIWSKPSKVYRLRKELEGTTKVIACTNLRYDVTETDIREYITKAFDYKVHKVMIFENAKGFRYGMAKVWFSSYEHAKSVVDALNGTLLKGRVMRMNYWEQRNEKRGGGRHKSKKAKRKNKVKTQNNWEWNDKWFEENVDRDTKQSNTDRTPLKVPQRLLDQLL